MMSLSMFDNGCPAYVVGLAHGSPPRYARFKEAHPSGWMWTSELAKAELFRTETQAKAHLRGDMAPLVAGTNARVLKVELKVGPV